MIKTLRNKVPVYRVSITMLELVGLFLASSVIHVVSILFADNYKADAVSRIMVA